MKQQRKRALEPLPVFKNEAEEREFWKTHDTTRYVDWDRAKIASFPKLRPSETTVLKGDK